MKRLDFKNIVIAIVMIAFAGMHSYAQPGTGNAYGRDDKGQGKGRFLESIPNITPEQLSQIEKLRATHVEKMREFKNLLNENKAQYQSLMTAKEPDMKAINANIDESTQIKNKMMKEKTQHHLDLRKLLTDEQRVYFDQEMLNRKDRGNFDRQGPEKAQGQKKCTGKALIDDIDVDEN